MKPSEDMLFAAYYFARLHGDHAVASAIAKYFEEQPSE